jgi:hypothetical protein
MRSAIVLLLAFSLMSCVSPNSQTLTELKMNLKCIEMQNGLLWADISREFGTADILPLPEAGTNLGKNARGYRDEIVIFYTDLKEVKEGEKTRFNEVVYKTEICRKK